VQFLQEYRDDLTGVLHSVDLGRVEEFIQILERAREEERGIFVFGNGGSAATASHFAVDMVKGASVGRQKRFRIMALTDQVPTITAYANDMAYDVVFEQHLRNFARPGDVVIAISCSGNSPNVLRAVEYGNSIDCTTIGFSGFQGGQLASLARHALVVPSTHMGRIEDAHMFACHLIAYYFMENDKVRNQQATC
jgi:D-sedoheptulose 7-phosphate isomerase